MSIFLKLGNWQSCGMCLIIALSLTCPKTKVNVKFRPNVRRCIDHFPPVDRAITDKRQYLLIKAVPIALNPLKP